MNLIFKSYFPNYHAWSLFRSFHFETERIDKVTVKDATRKFTQSFDLRDI